MTSRSNGWVSEPQPAAAGEPLALTAKEAAERLRLSVRHLRVLVRRGEVAAVKLGRAIRFRPEDLAAFLARRVTGPAVDASAADAGAVDAATALGQPAE